MKKIFLVFLTLNSIVLFSATETDRSGAYQCKCEGSVCDQEYSFTYDRNTLFVRGEGKSWILSGYVTRQEAKLTGAVYLSIPESVSFQRETVVFHQDGKVTSRNGQFTCTRKE